MSDTTQRLCTNHDCQISFVFSVYFYGFLYTEGANSWGRFWRAALVLIAH